ncbi:MAG TPA: flagellar protein FlgN [Clostridiales bacterium]|nr:flagellar protein FlgN [Clostridiales bacterium]
MVAVTEATQALLQVLEESMDLINKLIQSAGEKESLLVAADVEGLSEVLEREEELVLTLQEKEQERISKADALANALGLSESGLRLKDLIGLIDDADCGLRLTETGNRLSKALDELASANSKIRELLHHQIDYTDFMLNLIINPKSKVHAYDIQGNTEENGQEPSLLEYHA